MLIRTLQNNKTLPSTCLSVTLVSESFRRYCKVNLIRTTVRGGLTCFPHMHEPYATHPSESHARILVETILGKKAWPNPSVLLVALASICGRISTNKKVVPITKQPSSRMQASLPKSMRSHRGPDHLIMPTFICCRAYNRRAQGSDNPSQLAFPRLVIGVRLEFFWTATSTSISRATAEPK